MEAYSVYMRFVKSYGAMNELAFFLSSHETLFLQALNKWMYNTGVCRI